MADEINAQERLQAVDELITDCETIAIEIEGQFEQFEGSLTDTEARSAELIVELDQSSSEVVQHTQEFEGQLLSEVASLADKAITFAATMNGMMETVQSNSDELFGKMDEMEGAHETIQSQIEENAGHMRDIFENLTSVWSNVNDTMNNLQDQRHSEIESDIHNLSTDQLSEQGTQQTNAQGVFSQQYNDVIVDNAQTHMNTIQENFDSDFKPGVETLTDTNRSMQEQDGQEFFQFRTDTVGNMFENANMLYQAVDGVMTTMKTTTNITSNVADVTVTAMDQTNIGLNQLNEAIDNVISMLGTLSLD